ncbi:hypothetical protein FJZ53_01930 [Candidatus Woesearchaeota archaeon]|nr:hypothetical protein [Candidatus Woesearchaeota archaeon]
MAEIRDKCAVCGKEIVITDEKVIAYLKNAQGKDKGTKLYCSEACKKKIKHQIEGSLDVGEIFS